MNPEVTSGGVVEVTAKEVEPVTPPNADDLLTEANAIGEQLRALIVKAKKLPRGEDLEAHQDPSRALSLAQMYLQTGFSWLRKAIKPAKEF